MFCDLEHQLLHFYKDQKFLKSAHIYLAVSGGLDSMSMLVLHQNLTKILKIKLAVIYVYHWDLNSCAEQKTFRKQAFQMLKSYCKEHNILFFSNAQAADFKTQADKITKKQSEADYRKTRYQYFDQVLQQSNADLKILATAHTAEDLLETRLLRLMRGVGGQGFSSIEAVKQHKHYLLIRPLLNISKKDLKWYVTEKNINFFTDPSNKDKKFLRNWLRESILSLIEKKNPKYLQNMSQSFNLMAQQLQKTKPQTVSLVENKINLNVFNSMAISKQKQILAQYLYVNKIKNYSMGHVLELLKHLNSSKKEQSFNLGKRLWLISKSQLYVLDNSPKSTKLKNDFNPEV